MRHLPHFLLACSLAAPAFAQNTANPPAAVTPSPSSTPAQAPASDTNRLSVSANLVVLPTIVRDKKDALVNNLTQSDFDLKVDGKSQTIRYFDHDTDVPLTLGLLVDVSRSQSSVLDAERSASVTFLDKMLVPASEKRAADKAFIVQFAAQVELLQDVTDSRPRLQAALKELNTASPSFQPTTNSSDSGNGASHAHGGTALYDSVFLSADEITSKVKGRRALILLTDGVDRNSKESITTAIEAAQRADTIIYAIYYKGEEHRDFNNGNPGGRHGGYGGGYPGGGYPGGGYPGGGYPGGGYPGGGYPGGGNNPNNGGGNNHPTGADHTPYVDGRKVLERMCGETGGRVFEVSKHDSVDQIYAEIGDELRSQYRLGFTPTTDITQTGYHKIDLGIVGPRLKDHLNIQTREGYYTSN